MYGFVESHFHYRATEPLEHNTATVNLCNVQYQFVFFNLKAN